MLNYVYTLLLNRGAEEAVVPVDASFIPVTVPAELMPISRLLDAPSASWTRAHYVAALSCIWYSPDLRPYATARDPRVALPPRADTLTAFAEAPRSDGAIVDELCTLVTTANGIHDLIFGGSDHLRISLRDIVQKSPEPHIRAGAVLLAYAYKLGDIGGYA